MQRRPVSHTHPNSGPKPDTSQRGIQSIEVGGQLLRALAHQGRPMALKDLAAAAGMAAAKAHPYLVSFGKIGLVKQDRASGRYGLGSLALQLGLMSTPGNVFDIPAPRGQAEWQSHIYLRACSRPTRCAWPPR